MQGAQVGVAGVCGKTRDVFTTKLQHRPECSTLPTSPEFFIMVRETACFVLLLLAVLSSYALQYDPEPNPSSVVEVGQARFTVLTSHLIRMEWGATIDAATFTFINRNLPTPEFNTSKDGDWTVIQTAAVKVNLYLQIVVFPCGTSWSEVEHNILTESWIL